MLHSLPEPESFEAPSAGGRRTPWAARDLAVFGIFFGLTVLLFPPLTIRVLQILRPGVRLTDLSGAEQVILQGVLDLLLVGFIVFHVRIVHGESFVDTIHWFRNYQLSTTFLVSSGAALALTVLLVSSFFPPSEPPPIEKHVIALVVRFRHFWHRCGATLRGSHHPGISFQSAGRRDQSLSCCPLNRRPVRASACSSALGKLGRSIHDPGGGLRSIVRARSNQLLDTVVDHPYDIQRHAIRIVRARHAGGRTTRLVVLCLN